MIKAKIKLLCTCVIVFLNFTVQAQIKTSENKKINTELTSFLIGQWKGSGEFANHRSISASLTFHFSLDSTWFIAEHTDVPPNRYKSMAMWGINKSSGEMIAYVFDNFGGFRQFNSSGWHDSQIVLLFSDTIGGSKIFQRFIYQKTGPNNLKMVYQKSTDNAVWKEGDHIDFMRESMNK